MIYSRNGSVASLESVGFSDGRIVKTSSGYDVNYQLTDHLGSVRVLFSQNGALVAQNDYYPFGGRHSNSQSTNSTSNRFKYNGKEEQTTGEIGFLDYGARMYDDYVGRFGGIDPLSEKYFSIGTSVYCANNPINAIDIDGRLIIFINGYHIGDGATRYAQELKNGYVMFKGMWTGTREYWNDGGRRFDQGVMNHLNDQNAIYRDGSLNGSGFSFENRVKYGKDQGYFDAENIFNNLARNKDGSFSETIKIISHSMGGAYAQGYIEGLQKYAMQNNIEGYSIDFHAAFSPYQSNKIKKTLGVLVLQFSHSDDLIAKNKSILGGVFMDTSSDKKQGHSIFSFWNSILNLPTGKYDVINGGVYKVK